MYGIILSPEKGHQALTFCEENNIQVLVWNTEESIQDSYAKMELDFDNREDLNRVKEYLQDW